MTDYKLAKLTKAQVARLPKESILAQGDIKARNGEPLILSVPYKFVQDLTDNFTKPLDEIDESVRDRVAKMDSLTYSVLEQKDFFSSRQSTAAPKKTGSSTSKPTPSPNNDGDDDADLVAQIRKRIGKLEKTKSFLEEDEADLLAKIEKRLQGLNNTLTILLED